MKIKTIILMLKIKIYEKLLHRDVMELKIERYRMEGATIGNHVRAFSPISSGEPYLISIGDDVTISTGVRFCTHDNSAIKCIPGATDFVGPIKIGRNVFIGMNTILLGGIELGDNCIVGAGSIVTKSFREPGSIIAGNPAKIIGNAENLCMKNGAKAFNFRGMSASMKKQEIMKNSEKWIRK